MSGSGLLRGSGGAPDFDHPLEMLSACHDRIEDRCDLLHRLVEHLDSSGCDDQARQAASSVLRYFDTAGEHHHEDEEKNLFPALLARDASAAALIETLRADHAKMRESWRRLRPALVRLVDDVSGVASGRATGACTLVSSDVERFTSLHRTHIAREDAELLPLAGRVLDRKTMAAIGGAMAERRGVAR